MAILRGEIMGSFIFFLAHIFSRFLMCMCKHISTFISKKNILKGKESRELWLLGKLGGILPERSRLCNVWEACVPAFLDEEPYNISTQKILIIKADSLASKPPPAQPCSRYSHCLSSCSQDEKTPGFFWWLWPWEGGSFSNSHDQW